MKCDEPMTTTKELFLREKELSEKSSGIVATDWFQKWIAYAKAELMENPGMTADKLDGAREFIQCFCSLPQQEAPSFTVSTGLNHKIDDPQPQKPEA